MEGGVDEEGAVVMRRGNRSSGCVVTLAMLLAVLAVLGLVLFVVLKGARIGDGLTRRKIVVNVGNGVDVAVWTTLPKGFEEWRNDSDVRYGVVMEMLPYRQNDLFYGARYPLWEYFAKRGYVFAAVDVPGTGGSTGPTVPKEYSEEELVAGAKVIEYLALQPWSVGRIGLVGKSWSAFNALMFAMRNTPYLSAIYIAHGSEDLFFNDVHYTSGGKHFDDYILQQTNENILPQDPGYVLSAVWAQERLDAVPWLDAYLSHQDPATEFYRQNSAKFHYDKIKIPVYMLAGLFDEYRDYALRIYEGITAHVPECRVVVIPSRHKFAFESDIEPNYDDRAEMVAWFDKYVMVAEASQQVDPSPPPPVVLFLRESFLPGNLDKVPGRWVATSWPIVGATNLTLYMTADHLLSPSSSRGGGGGAGAVHSLPYNPTVGPAQGSGFYDTPPDMRDLDAQSLTYDYKVTADLTVVGWVQVCLVVSVDTSISLARWALRLEDVAADGSSSTEVTGNLFTSIYDGGVELLQAGQKISFCGDLLFTTYVFPAGNTLRVAVTGTLWPAWEPSPFAYTTQLHVGGGAISSISLPVISLTHVWDKVPPFTQVKTPDNAFHVPGETDFDSGADTWSVDASRASAFLGERELMLVHKDTFIGLFYGLLWTTDPVNPAVSRWRGFGTSLVVRNVSQCPSGSDLRTEVARIPKTFGDNSSIPSLTHLPFINLPDGSFFRIETQVDFRTNSTHFILSISWQVFESLHHNNASWNRTFDQSYPRFFQ